MRLFWLSLFFFTAPILFAQSGAIRGVVADEQQRPLSGASLRLHAYADSLPPRLSATGAEGNFTFEPLPFGYYKLVITFVGRPALTIDSLHLYSDRPAILLGELALKAVENSNLDEIIVYAEKPLIQSKDGNITFYAAESALSQGSSASDLLEQVPLVTKDADGKVMVRGKEPKILIDEKPVELNLQQLQDLLESLPGSSIEKIEVMTNPPPQYANEQGGVINIVTRKGTVGINSRLSVFAGTRGESGGNGSFSYRRQGLALNVNAGVSGNVYSGEGFSSRQNLYKDSSNYFKTASRYQNAALRPTLRASLDYDISKSHLLNAVVQLNQNGFENENTTRYQNINHLDELYRLSRRNLLNEGRNRTAMASLNYTYKSALPGEVFRIYSSYTATDNSSERQFYQQFLHPDESFTGNDSTQLLHNTSAIQGWNARLSYDRPLVQKTTFLSAGGYFRRTVSDITADAWYRQKADSSLQVLDLLRNHFLFYQNIANLRLAVRQVLGKSFSVTAGTAAENTAIRFDLVRARTDTAHAYWTLLPFINLRKSWENQWSLSFAYRKAIRRPGVNELNPTRDISDPYNVRSGNPALLASTSHNFDAVLGWSKNARYFNLSLGYNRVDNIFNPIRSLLADGTTETVWQNISGRKEYEMSTWSGYSLTKKLRINVSATYLYNRYGTYDKQVRKYRDGGSFTANLNANYTLVGSYVFTGNLTYNRFANPQGSVRSSLRMQLGAQAKFFQKRLTLSLQASDPFLQLENRTVIYGPNYFQENYSATKTRNFRLSLGYSFPRVGKKPSAAKTGLLPKSKAS